MKSILAYWQPNGRAATKRAVIEVTSDSQSLPAVLREIWDGRRLLRNFIVRNLKGRYRGTLLGNGWIVIRPLLEILPYIFVFSIFLKVSTEPLPYVVYLLSGFGAWQLFGGQVNASPTMMAKMRSIVGKIYFPRLIVPLTDLAVRLLDYAVVLAAVILLALGYGIMPVGALWALPLFTLLLLILSFGAGVIVTTLCTLRPDLSHGVAAGTRILFYASAVIYPLDIVPAAMRPWFEFNPLSTLISGIRWSLFGFYKPSTFAIAFAVVTAIGVLWVGLHIFLRVERRLADLL